MRFGVRIFQQGKSYSAMVPDLPGCVAAGSSLNRVRKLIAEAIALHLDMMRRSGEKIPRPSRRVDVDLAKLEEGEICTWVEAAMPQSVAT